MQRDSWFLAVETAADEGGAAQAHLCRPRAAHPDAALRSFALAGGRRMTVLGADAARVVETPRHWLRIVGIRPPTEALLQRLRCAASATELRDICISADGQDCSFFIIDKEAGACCAVTDLLNVAAIFHGSIGGHRFFGSNLSLFPREGLTLDLRGVASYIVNGNCVNNHTVFREIAHLERATIHEFPASGHEQRVYWSFAPGQIASRAPWRPAAAESQLWELLAESVDRVTRGRRVLLSLSGGYDSSVLLGILGARLKHPDVTCITYVYGPQNDTSDAGVARRQAALYGYEHIAAVSYSGDLLQMLDVNAALGQGRRRPAYEVEALARLAERYPDRSETVMLFGEECVGMWSYRMRSADDILGAARLKSPALLKRFEPVLGAERTAHLRAAAEAEYDALRKKARGFADPDDAKDFLYLDQRLPFGLLPLRTLFAGHWFPVATPLISRAVLDFMATVPVAYRVDKRLFKQMARRFLPEQFGIPRSIEGTFHPVFRQEIAAAHDVLAAAINARGWKIDGVFSTAALIDLLRMIRSDVATAARSVGAGTDVRKRLLIRAKALLTGNRLLEDRQRWWRRLVLNQFGDVPDPGYLLVNVLSLADVLADRPARMDRL